MKRMVLAVLLGLTLCSAAQAGETEDIQFEQYVELSKKSLDKGMSLIADTEYRLMVLTMPLAINHNDATSEVIRVMKNEAVKVMKQNDADVRIIKALKINMIFNYVTIDKKIIPIALSYKDL